MVRTLRSNIKVRPIVLGTAGVAVLAVAIGIQGRSSWLRWCENRIDAWRADVALDLSEKNTCSRTFVPIIARTHHIRFTLRAPLRGDFIKYRGKNKFIPPDVTERSLYRKDFKISWQLVKGEHVLSKGTVCASDLKAWAFKDHVRYQHAVGLPILQPETEYSLVAKVEKANEAANELNPTLLVRTWGSLKGRAVAGWKPSDTVLVSLIGGALIVTAFLKHGFDTRRHSRQVSNVSNKSQSEQSEGNVS